jgi:hypothetical protein
MSEEVKKKATPRKAAAKKKVIPPPETSHIAATDHEVALLAYQRWLDRGKHHGSDSEDWLQAEEQLKNR